MGGILATFPLHWILLFLFDGNDTDLLSIKFFAQLFSEGMSYEDAERFLSPFAIAIAFVLIGASIAPSHRFKTAIGLSVIWITSFLSLFIFMPEQAVFELRGLVGLVGSLIGLFLTWKLELDSSEKSSESH